MRSYPVGYGRIKSCRITIKSREIQSIKLQSTGRYHPSFNFVHYLPWGPMYLVWRSTKSVQSFKRFKPVNQHRSSPVSTPPHGHLLSPATRNSPSGFLPIKINPHSNFSKNQSPERQNKKPQSPSPISRNSIARPDKVKTKLNTAPVYDLYVRKVSVPILLKEGKRYFLGGWQKTCKKSKCKN